MMTIWMMEKNMPTGLNLICWPISQYVMSGVRIGDRTVETIVMVTDRATSPLLM